MRFIYFIFICFNSTIHLFSQQLIVTDISNNAIPFVQILSNNQYFFTQSNVNGKVEKIELDKLDLLDTLFFYHVAYEPQFRIKQSFSLTDTVKLMPKVYEIGEVVVSANNEPKKYILIDACYRAYQAENDSILYYIDGIAEYQSKVNKNKFKRRPKQYRSFVNAPLEEEIPHRSTEITFRPTVPGIQDKYLPIKYFKKHNIKQVKNKATNKIELYDKYNQFIGEIEISPSFIKYHINDIFIIGSRKAFKTEVNIVKKEITMMFKNKGLTNLASLKDFDDLVYIKSHTELKVKHDKDKKYKKINSTSELFIENIAYTNFMEDIEYSNSAIRQKSKYETQFWENCKCEVYYLPNPKLIRGLKEQ